jgi:phosphotransferase system enzyme I (PtsI)
MISCVEEIIQVKKLIDKAVWALEEEEKIFNKNIPLGLMIEVPSAVMMAEEFGQYVDFFSIGTNDLIQYSMAIDRGNRHVAHLNQPLNPAMIRLLKMIMDASKRSGVDVAMCGEMAGDPFNLPVLMGLGLKELSMNPGSIPVVKQMVRKMDSSDTKKLVEEILKMGKVADIIDHVKTKYRNFFPLGESDVQQDQAEDEDEDQDEQQ